MSEADEIAAVMLDNYKAFLANDGEAIIPSFTNARRFVISDYAKLPGGRWEDWISHQMLDNIAESLFNQVRQM